MLMEALPLAFAPLNLFAAVIGLIAGIIFGAIPGLSATLAIALFVPVTFLLDPTHGITMLGGIYAGAIFGGSITAILINIPGTPASIVTAFEGHAMAKRGDAPYALGLAALSSGVGGFLSAIAMLFLAPVLGQLALSLGPAEFVGLVIFSLVVVVVMVPQAISRNALSCVIGLFLATIGFDPVQGTSRFTFGFSQISSGFNVVAVLIGFFCMTQALVLARDAIQGREAPAVTFGQGSAFGRILQALTRFPAKFLRASSLGTVLGIMPAIGPESTPFLAHAMEKRFSRNKDQFGKGSEEGLIASEASISANVGGSLIPLLSLGIPGSGAAAMFIGALTLHGLRPGPLLFVEHGPVIYAFLIAFAVTNLIMIIFGIFGARYFAVVLKLPKGFTATLVMFFSVFGAYAVNNSMFDVWVMIGVTVFALLLGRAGIPLLPLILGMLLGPLLEENLSAAIIGLRDLSGLMGRPIALIFGAMSCITLAVSLYQRAQSGSSEPTLFNEPTMPASQATTQRKSTTKPDTLQGRT